MMFFQVQLEAGFWDLDACHAACTNKGKLMPSAKRNIDIGNRRRIRIAISSLGILFHKQPRP